MALFGLGNFGQGFVEGFANTANKALQEDIERINLRAGKVADFQVKRTVEAQEKRKKDLEEIEDALREAEGLFDKDDPRAASYAASLLRDQGSASALKAFTAEIKNSNVFKSGQSLANFMEIAEKGMPSGTTTDYANAFLGSPSLPSDYRLPENAVSAGAGNLLDALGLKPDMSSMVSDQVSEQMSAMGVSEKAQTTISLPSGTFMREKFTMGNMTPSNRLKYINEQLASDNNTQERITQLQGMLTKAQDAVYNTGSEEDQLSVVLSKLSRAEGDERKRLTEEAANLKRNIKLKEAETSSNPLDLLDANLEVALSDAVKTGNYDDYNRLKKERDNIGKPVDPQVELEDAKRELAAKVQNGLDPNSEEYKTALAAIRQDEILIDQIYSDGGEVNTAEADRFGNMMQDAIDLDVAENLTGEQRDLFNTVSAALKSYGGSLEMFKKQDPTQYKQYMNIVAANKQIQNSAISRVLSLIPENSKNRINAVFAAQSRFNYGGQAQAAATQAVSEVEGDGAAVTDGEGDGAAVTDGEGGGESVDAASTAELKKRFSDDEAGANKMVNALLTKGISIEAAITDAKTKGYSPAFISVLEENKEINSPMAKIAIEDSNIQTDIDETQQAMNIVDSFHNTALAPKFIAQPSKVNRLVREALGLGDTDKDKERANKIIEQARQQLVERDKTATKGVNRRTGRARRASGGLMSRG